MSTLRTTNIIHGSSAISNIVLDNQGRAIFGPDGPQGRAALYVNAQTNRVGVNNESPAVALDVDGAINATGNVAFGGTLNVTGNISINTNTLFVDTVNQRVGINTNAPEQQLHVVNPSTSAARIRLGNTEGFIDIGSDDGDGFFTVGTSEVLRLEHDGTIGQVGINHNAPVTVLDIRDSRTHTYDPISANSNDQTAFLFTNNNSGLANQCSSLTLRVSANGSTNNAIATLNAIAIGDASNNTNVTLQLRNATAGIFEALRVKETGQILLGGDTPEVFSSFATPAGRVQIQGPSYQSSSLAMINYQAAADSAYLLFGHSRGTGAGDYTALIDNDLLGSIWFAGASGDRLKNSARIEARVDGAITLNSVPSRIRFLNTRLGASDTTSRGQLSDDGRWVLGVSETRVREDSKYPLEISCPSASADYSGIFIHNGPYVSRSGAWMTSSDNDSSCAIRFTFPISGNTGYNGGGINAIGVASNTGTTTNYCERILYKFNLNTTTTPVSISDVAVEANEGSGINWTLTSLGESTDAEGNRFFSLKLLSTSSSTNVAAMTANLVSYVRVAGAARLSG